MFLKREMQITVKDGDKVLRTIKFEVNDTSEVTIEVLPDDVFPVRSPLHEKSLNMQDLKPGLHIKCGNVHEDVNLPSGIIIGEAFKRTDYPVVGRECWMISVATINYAGKLVKEDWSLTTIGVAPLERSDGTQQWNSHNYTLAVG
jgi:hypothetical protein